MGKVSSDNKRLAKNTFYLYFRSIFLLAISLYTSRVTLQVLGVEDYGVYNVVGGVVGMFSMLSMTMASASQRFITYALGEKDEKKLKSVFSTCITLHIILGVIVVALLEVVGIWFLYNKLNIPAGRLDAAAGVMHVSIATFFVGVVSVPFNAVIIAHERMSTFAYISIIEGLLKLGACFLLMVVRWDKLTLYAVFMFLISLMNCCIYAIYCRRHFDETRNLSFSVDKPLFEKMFAFAGWNLFGNGSLVLRNQGVDIVLNLFNGVVINAAKGISNQVQNAVQNLIGNFTTALRPQLTKAVAQKNYLRVYGLINNGSRYSFIMMMILAVPIIITAPRLLELWLGENVPDFTVEFVRWTMVYLLLDSLSRMMIHAILSEGNIKTYQICVGGTKLLAVPMVYVMLRVGMSPMSGIWANIFLEMICLGERLYFNKKLINLDYSKFIRSVVARCLTLLAISLGLSYLFVRFVTDLFIPSVVVTVAVSCIAIWIIGLDRQEHQMILTFIGKNLHRKQ